MEAGGKGGTEERISASLEQVHSAELNGSLTWNCDCVKLDSAMTGCQKTAIVVVLCGDGQIGNRLLGQAVPLECYSLVSISE